MLAFIRRNRVLLASGFLSSLSLLMASVNAQHPGRIDPLGKGLLALVGPLQKVVSGSLLELVRVKERYIALVNVEKEKEKLLAELAAARQELVRLEEARIANERLRKLLAFRETLGHEVLVAGIVGREASAWFRAFTVDKGEADGVRKGMAVFAAEGVVGQIAATARHTSRVLLLCDRNSGVEVLVQRTRVRGVVGGFWEGGCELRYVGRNEDIRKDDLLITSGLDGIFPKGMVVGRVGSITRGKGGLFLKATVVPGVDFDRLEEVLITAASVE